MSLIGGIVGGMIGFTLLGPIGALVGSVMGSRMTRQAKSRRNPNNLDHQVAFFTALFACLAKIAKADGRVSEEEVSKIESFISNKFNFNGHEYHYIGNNIISNKHWFGIFKIPHENQYYFFDTLKNPPVFLLTNILENS